MGISLTVAERTAYRNVVVLGEDCRMPMKSDFVSWASVAVERPIPRETSSNLRT